MARRSGRLRDVPCVIEGCSRYQLSRGWCGTHYQRWRNNGDPLVSRINRQGTDLERFLDKLDWNGPLAANRPDLGRCILWTGAPDPKGYGWFTVTSDGQERRHPAHRWIYEEIVGPVPSELVMDHFACDNPPCVNLLHVCPTTHRANVLRGNGTPACNARKTECIRGHPFDEKNTGTSGDGRWRYCLTCSSAQGHEGYLRRKGLVGST